MRFLVAESETAQDRADRRERAGKSSGESFQATLEQMAPGAEVTRVEPADADGDQLSADEIAAYDAVFLTGSPLHVYDDAPEVERQLAFMRAVFDSGVPSFGSCAGLQVAVAAAGGRVRKMPERLEAAVGRRITTTEAGRDHPLLAGRAPAWDAASVHGDEVEELPEGALLLATNGVTRVQAVEIRHGNGVFWGVQYHPELSPGEIASAIRAQGASLVEEGLASDEAAVEQRAVLLDRIQRDPDDHAARWELGVDDEFAHEDRRRLEIANFIAAIPTLRAGGGKDRR
ncbi:GMP synthase (glutamine-hydrolysing) [Sphingomonas palmae]|uniref:GMP synthase (Glutamine-hydrolysing) n=1 Tax=Sphingomonas palmae TaxID=1855283 RepID=A0A1H7LHM9_9SPHN|nr:type 1 glutamine amidotransferase [Sphingomonas palmae]SEK98451.1 GMP synthase (glutamine-hydrolysing) [Sphingomonas palmae]